MSSPMSSTMSSTDQLPAYPHDEHYAAPVDKKEASKGGKFSLNLPSTWSINPSKRATEQRATTYSTSHTTWPIDPATQTARTTQTTAAGTVDPAFNGPRHAVASRGEVDPITGTSRTITNTTEDRRGPIRSAWSLNPSATPRRDAFGGRREPVYTTAPAQRAGAFGRVDSTWPVNPSPHAAPPAYSARA